MWIYSVDETEAINMEHTVSIRLQGEAHEVMVIATTTEGEEVVIKTCDSGGEARDFLKWLLTSMNSREFQK